MNNQTQMLEIRVEFDGAAPFSRSGISHLGESKYEIRPSWRAEPGISEEEKGAGFRLCFAVYNRSKSKQILECFIHWEDSYVERLRLRDWVSVLNPCENEWVYRDVLIQGEGGYLKLEVQPGLTVVSSAPCFNYGDVVSKLKSISPQVGISLNAIGKSEENRPIHSLVIGNERFALKDCFVMARNHAYESASTYCLDGMIDFLLSRDDLADHWKSKYRFHILPMTNPDGVYHGMSRLTSPCGADLNRIRFQKDSAWLALKKYFDQVKPSVCLNVHNWQFKSPDGLLVNDEEVATKFIKYMPDLKEDQRTWRVEWREQFLEREKIKDFKPGSDAYQTHASWKDYVKDQWQGVGITLEFPWYGRSTQRMKAIGKKSLISLLNTMEEG